ncbi:MAG: hypothetical protein M3Y65_05945 [Pseudomonadota bacterium]|nr:hypothetical protein [Pseudomonadota bacterium]
MKAVKVAMCFLLSVTIAACGVVADRFPGTVVPPPTDLTGQWTLDFAGKTSVFSLTPAATNHYRVSQPGSPEPDTVMDASIQLWQGAPFLIIADLNQKTGTSIFRVLDANATSIRIAALDPAKTAAVLQARGLPIARKKMWLYEEIVLTGPAMEAVLATPAADVFAMSEGMTLHRVQ